MNKILQFAKYLLYVICFILIFVFIKKYDLSFKESYTTKVTIGFIILLSLLFISFILNIIDLIKLKKLIKLKGYNFLTIIDLLSLIIILLITCYSKFIISNSLRQYAFRYYDIYGYKYFLFYANFISILFIINIVYYFVNIKKCK